MRKPGDFAPGTRIIGSGPGVNRLVPVTARMRREGEVLVGLLGQVALTAFTPFFAGCRIGGYDGISC
jgi:hypothetical protein